MVESSSNETFSSSMSKASNYNKWIVNTFEPYIGKELLEIGIGHGGFYPLLKDKIKTYSGLDIDKKLVTQAKKLFPENGYYHGDISNSSSLNDVPNNKFDTIFCCNVLEHIKNDEQALANMLSVLKPEGNLLLFVPAFVGLYNDMDKLAGHHRRYIKQNIVDIMPKKDANIIFQRYFNSVGGFGWWLNKFITHNSLENKAVSSQVEFFDKVIIPFSKISDVFISKFFGQSLILAIQKQNKEK